MFEIFPRHLGEVVTDVELVEHGLRVDEARAGAVELEDGRTGASSDIGPANAGYV